MNCKCGYPAFYFEKISDNKKWAVYRCGYSMVDTKKKAKCDLLESELISEITAPVFNVTIKPSEKTTYVNVEKKYREELAKFINLCEIAKDFPAKYRANYISNINYLLRKLNFSPYFEENETLENLKIRTKYKYIPRIAKISVYPIRLVDYSSELAVNKIKKTSRKKTKSKVKKTKNVILDLEIEPEVEKNEEPESDSESESSEADEDETFDVDNYDSEEECEEFDESGAISD